MMLRNLLLDNKTVKQTILKNTFWIYLGIGLRNIIAFILIIYVVRMLGATEYGKFTFALAFVSLFSIISDLGISTILTRELSGEKEKLKEKLKEFYSILSLKIFLGFGMLILIIIGSFFITVDPITRRIILILAAYVYITQIFLPLIYSLFQARQKMEYQSWGEILVSLVTAICVFLLIFKFPTAKGLSYGYLLASLISSALILTFFHFRVFPLKLVWDKLIWKKFLLMSWPLALTGLFGSFYTYIDSVMMGYWGQISQTGWYNAAYRIVWATVMLTGILCGCVFPAMSEAFKKSKEKLQEVWDFQTESMTIVTFPMVVGGVVLAPKIIGFIYGPEFTPSIFAFQILIIMGGAIILYDAFKAVLIVSHQEKKLFWAIFLGAIINFILNLVLIPKYSLYGAAIAAVITHFLISLLLFKFTLIFTSINLFKIKLLVILVGAILSSGLMFLVISRPQISNLNIFLSIPIGVITYLACFLIYREIVHRTSAFKNLNIRIIK